MPGPPYVRLAGDPGSPVLLTCEHAYATLPVRRGVGRREREIVATHWGWDPGAWALTRDVARRLRATALGGRWSRLWVDLNRRADDPTLIRTRVEGHDLAFNAGVDLVEKERRLRTCHAPYHDAIDSELRRRVIAGVRPLVFAVHSFTPVLGSDRRDFDVGVLFDADERPARRLGRALAREGLVVRYNRPYSGRAGMMYSADRHGRHFSLPNLELEMNQALAGSRRAMDRLGRAVSAALAPLIGPAPRAAPTTKR